MATSGAAAATTALYAGEITMVFASTVETLPHVRAGRAKVLGVTTAQRVPSLPNVPAIAEFVPGYVALNWYAFAGPQGLDPTIVTRMVETLGSLRDPERLRPWLMAVAANEARQILRRQRRYQVVQIEVADIGSPHGDPAAHTALADLAVALGRLSPEDRTLLALRHVAGFDATEIGRELGMSASGVRSRLARLLERLRSELADA